MAHRGRSLVRVVSSSEEIDQTDCLWVGLYLVYMCVCVNPAHVFSNRFDVRAIGTSVQI